MMNIHQQRRESVYSNTTISYTRDVCCDGQQLLNVPNIVHPLVRYRIGGKTNQVSCEYCGKTFAYIEREV